MIPPNLLELIYFMNLVLFHAINPSSSSVYMAIVKSSWRYFQNFIYLWLIPPLVTKMCGQSKKDTVLI